MSFLEVQVSPRRLKIAQDVGTEALKRAGKPYRQWAIVIESPKDGDPYAMFMAREDFDRRFTAKGANPEWPAAARKHPREVPEIIFWDGDRAHGDLYWITPPEGTW